MTAPANPLPLRARLAASVAGGLLTGLMRTTRYEAIDEQHYREWLGSGRTAIYVLWHGRLLPCSYRHRHEGLATLISQHRDGDYIARVVEGWGFRTVRGSSSRGGGAALRQLVRLLREGTSIAVTPDGPRGPRQKMKLGPLLAARLTGVPMIPVTAGTDRAWWFEGWDRFLVPKPFARFRIAYGAPIFVPRTADEGELERLADEMEARLNALTEVVDGG
ncbi:MAG TPA: lysophospholipid acyltransferase family protein [Longimicrobiaceae bacterium]|nr:lysophospholipid acyltransferase family protein [Longimicrobiaceae bacterium]